MKKDLFTLIILILTFSFSANSQSSIPSELESLVGLSLNNAHNELNERGYMMAMSNFGKRQQLWWNEVENRCVVITFNKKGEQKVESVISGDAESCKKGAEASRKMLEKYHDGQAPVNSEAIDSQRTKLSSEGYQVIYWVEDFTPGRTLEVWYKEETNESMEISWNTKGEGKVSVVKSETTKRVNPARRKN